MYIINNINNILNQLFKSICNYFLLVITFYLISFYYYCDTAYNVVEYNKILYIGNLSLNDCVYKVDLVDCTPLPATTIQQTNISSYTSSPPPLSSIRTLLMTGNNLSIDILSWNHNNIYNNNNYTIQQSSSTLLLQLTMLNLAYTQLTDQSLAPFDIIILCPLLVNLTLNHNHLKVTFGY